MKHKGLLMLLLAVAVALGMPAEGFGQKKGGAEDDYNLKKAWEEVQKDNYDSGTALKLLGKQLEVTPDNVEALYLRARVYMKDNEYALALTDLNRAIKINKPKKTNFANSTLHAWKASVYANSGDFMKAEEEQGLTVALARKDNRESLPSFLRGYAHYLYVNDKYDESDAAYNECLKENEGDTHAMAGLARNQIGRKNYDGAIEILEKCRALSPEYAEVEHFEALAYDGKGETDKAIDRVIALIDKDFDLVDNEMLEILSKHMTYTIAKIRSGIRNADNPEIFKYMLPAMLQKAGEYEDAFFAYQKNTEEFGEELTDHMAQCLTELGMNELALDQIERYLSRDKENVNALAEKGDILKRLQRYEDALKVYDEIIEIYPMSAWGYYAKGWCFELMGDDEAMKYYDTGIDLDSNYPYIFLMRGEMRMKNGDAAGAEEDFRRVVQIDTTADTSSCRMYALHFLGQDKEAEEWIQTIIDKNPGDVGVWYDKACLLCRMGREDDAMEALRTSLSKGCVNFAHIEADDDLDPIRGREDFKSMVEEYRKKSEERQKRFLERLHEARLEKDNENGHITTEIAINRKGGGTFEVPCTVNGLELKMFFDTGASDVTISSVEANFMLKNGQLSKDDIKGKKYYQIANGDIAEGTTVVLREVKIGDAVLHNVDASVVHSQKAPLLLGQSALERFGTITIDNINSKLLIQQ